MSASSPRCLPDPKRPGYDRCGQRSAAQPSTDEEICHYCALATRLPQRSPERPVDWKFRVVKSLRGEMGKYFDFGGASTFGSLAAAREYAAAFSAAQRAAGVHGAMITVRTRGGRGRVVAMWCDGHEMALMVRS